MTNSSILLATHAPRTIKHLPRKDVGCHILTGQLFCPVGTRPCMTIRLFAYA